MNFSGYHQLTSISVGRLAPRQVHQPETRVKLLELGVFPDSPAVDTKCTSDCIDGLTRCPPVPYLSGEINIKARGEYEIKHDGFRVIARKDGSAHLKATWWPWWGGRAR